MKKLRIRQFDELKVCPFKDGICIDRILQKNCELLPVCLEVAKIKLLKEISKDIKSLKKGLSKK